MGPRKDRKGKLVEQSGAAAIAFLEALEKSTSVFPPLQSVVGGTLHIAKLVRNFRSDKKKWTEFSQYIEKIVVDVIGKLPDTFDAVREDIKESIRQLSVTLSTIGKEIEEIQNKPTGSRFFMSATRPDKISDMKQRLEDSMKLLERKINMFTHMDVATIAAVQKESCLLQRNNQAVTGKLFDRCMEMIGSTITFTALPYTSNAGWDDTQTCLAGTRQAEIAKVMAWVREKDLSGTEQIYFLADVVGSGKTALAHSIAQECFDCKLLTSSFFFDRKVGRTNPRDFISNLARDLGSRFPEVSTYISLALRADPNLALSQPVSRLFKELILEPVIQSGIPGPIVVVIDALQEAETPEVQNILRTQIANLSGQFRVFVTSRPEHSVLRSLGPAITPHDLAIHESANRADMNTYVTHKLEEICSEHHELENWPDQQLVKTLLDRAEGLFVWIATICDYISHHIYPDKILKDLLKTMREFQLPPEEKMDALYSTIMAVCPWDDAYFVDGYQQVIGMMAVEKIPLTVDGLQKLHDSLPKSMLRVKAIVDKLASLITGSTGLNRPIRILHGSFREYITQRAPGNHRIFVEQHNAQLALTCLHILCTKLSAEITEFGYLNSSKGSGVPDVEIDFTEEQLYAIEFWLAHITDCDFVNPPIGLKAELAGFLHLFIQTWIEIIASKSKYQSLIPLRKRLPDELVPELSKFRLGPPLRRLLKRLLEDESRLGEVLLVMEDLKEMGESNWDTNSDSDGESSLELESVTDSSDDGYRDASSSE